APFPVTAADLRVALDALDVESDLRRDSYSLAQLRSDVVEPSGSLRAVDVHKHRERHTVDGCAAERSSFTLGRRVAQTVAVESEDPALLLAAVERIGLVDRPNVCVARGLKTLVGFETLRYAVIDTGTNSVKFHVGELRPDGSWRT